MKNKKLFVPTALVFFMLLFAGSNVKAQIGIYMNAWSIDRNWTIYLTNESTYESYTFTVSNYNFTEDGRAHVGGVPPGTYTMIFASGLDEFAYPKHLIGINNSTVDEVTCSYNYPYTWTGVVIDYPDGCEITVIPENS